jgi:hypothetical protein
MEFIRRNYKAALAVAVAGLFSPGWFWDYAASIRADGAQELESQRLAMDLRENMATFSERNLSLYVQYVQVVGKWAESRTPGDNAARLAEIEALRVGIATNAEYARATERQLARIESREPRELAVMAVPERLPAAPSNFTVQ